MIPQIETKASGRVKAGIRERTLTYYNPTTTPTACLV